MKILLLGSTGQLGYEAHRTLFCYGDLIAVDYPEVDFTKPKEVISFINLIKPDLVYNAIAYTDVDRAESEPEKAIMINCNTPGEIATYCFHKQISLIHISTDYVFDGKKNAFYCEEDLPNPINVYGKSKLDGEMAIKDTGCEFLIFRTSWVYSSRIGGFVKKVIQWAQNNEELRIVDDQIGNPTWARTLAILSTQFVGNKNLDLHQFFQEKEGIYHLAGGGFSSRFEWTKAIIKHLPENVPTIVKSIVPAKTSDFPTPAKRPLFSALDCSKFESTFSLKIPNWEIAVKLMMKN